MAQPISITGAGVVSPFGTSLDAFRDALLDGRTGIAREPGAEAWGTRTTLSARVGGFDPAAWIAPMKLRRMDTTGPMALVMARQAMEMAGYVPSPAGDDRAGVVIGTWSAGGQATSDFVEALFAGGPTNAPALLFNSTVGNAAAGLIGLEAALRGPNATVAHKEASGLAAIDVAVDLLRADRADALLAGGVDAIYPLFFRAHDAFKVMSAAPAFDRRAAAFARDGAGFILGEGAYGVWLERTPRPGARVLGEILGVASGSASADLNDWPACATPIARVMRAALDDAGIEASAVDVVYASANGAPRLDAIEAEAIGRVFGREGRPVVTSVKPAIGESGAASAAAVVAALTCGSAGLVPPIAGLEAPLEVATPLGLAATRVAVAGRIALVSAVASGGALVSLVLSTAPPAPSPSCSGPSGATTVALPQP